jgi:hypothetical protein
MQKTTKAIQDVIRAFPSVLDVGGIPREIKLTVNTIKQLFVCILITTRTQLYALIIHFNYNLLMSFLVVVLVVIHDK